MTENVWLIDLILYSVCGIIFLSLSLGWDDIIFSSSYICIESALIITPLIFFAKDIAKFDFPIPVGPEITIIGTSSKLVSEILLSISWTMDISNLMF